MKGIKLSLSLSVDERTGEVQMAYLRVREGKSAETKEVSGGRALADYDGRGRLIGIELLAPCSGRILDRLASREPAPVRQFLRGAAPRKLITA